MVGVLQQDIGRISEVDVRLCGARRSKWIDRRNS